MNRIPRSRFQFLAVAVLLIPYALAPLYRFVDPVSTPMFWRWVTGKRVHILFDDGDQAMVTPEKIKPLSFQVGDRLCCRRKGGPAELKAFADHVKSLWRKV